MTDTTIKKVYILTKKELFWVRCGINKDWMPRVISPSNLGWMLKSDEYYVDEAKVLSRNRLLEAAHERRLFWIDPNDEAEGGDLG